MKKFLIFMLIFISVFQVANASVIMGKYEQDNDIANGKEDIEWIVLEKDSDKMLLMSKYCLDTCIFYNERVPMYWGKSPLRKWLNTEFMLSFSDEEKKNILQSTIKNTNPHGMKGAGDDTLDYVFFLSKEEVLKYMPTMQSRVAYPTQYAIAKGCTLDKKTGSCRWWTRTSGARKMDICGMRLDGRITAYGMQDVDWPGNTMRPCMWVKIK